MPANFKLQKRHDEAFKFAQDSSFYYLTGVNEPECLLVMDGTSEWLLTPKPDEHLQLWEGQASTEELSEVSGIKNIQVMPDGWQNLKKILAKKKTIYLPMPYSTRQLQTYYHMHPNPARNYLLKKLRGYKSGLNLKDIRPEMAKLRMIKTTEEIKAINKAAQITLKAISSVESALPNLKTERDVEAYLEFEFFRNGAEGKAFDSIVASGSHSAQIHYMKNDTTKVDKNLLLLDVGARYQGYAADISRTLSLKGFNPRQQEIFDAVRSLVDTAKSMLKPGLSFIEYERDLEKRAVQISKDLAIGLHPTIGYKKGRAIPHAVSHHLGLDVHDTADYSEKLKPGMVVTVEPGLYSVSEGIGVRIEDDILITKSGCIELGKKLPLKLLQ